MQVSEASHSLFGEIQRQETIGSALPDVLVCLSSRNAAAGSGLEAGAGGLLRLPDQVLNASAAVKQVL